MDLLLQIAVDGALGDLLCQAGHAVPAKVVVVEDTGHAVQVVDPLEVEKFGARGKAGAAGQGLVGGAGGEQHHSGGAVLAGAAGGLREGFDGAHGVGGGLNGLVDVAHPPALPGLHIAVPHQVGQGPAHRIPGALKLTDEHIFRGEQAAHRVVSGLNLRFQGGIDLFVFLPGHREPPCLNNLFDAVPDYHSRPGKVKDKRLGEFEQKTDSSFMKMVH